MNKCFFFLLLLFLRHMAIMTDLVFFAFLFMACLLLEGKICDAVEVAGKNVMSTSSTVTTELVDHKY